MDKHISLGAISVFEYQGLMAKMSTRFHQTKGWEKRRIEEEYTLYIDHMITRAIKTSNA